MATNFTNAEMNTYRDILVQEVNNSGTKLSHTVTPYGEPIKNGSLLTHQSATHAGIRNRGNQASPNIDLEYKRRKLTASPTNWSTLLDDVDINRLVSDPKAITGYNAQLAMGRARDGITLAAAVTDDVINEDNTTVAFDTANFEVTAAARTGDAILDSIKQCRQLLEEAEVDMSMEEVFVILTPAEKMLVIETDEMKSWMNNSRRNYEKGELMDGWWDFNFITRAGVWSDDHGSTTKPIVPEDATDRFLPVYCKSGLVFGAAG